MTQRNVPVQKTTALPSEGRLDHVQLLRVLACAGVFVSHLAQRVGLTGRAYSIANFGASGVYVFFLLSGFLACRARELQPGNDLYDVAVYYLKRLFRIFPLYYAVICFYMVLYSGILRDAPPDPGGLYWLRFFLITNIFVPADGYFWSNQGGTWTIGLFIAFYLLAPLLVRAAKSLWRAYLLYASGIFLHYLWIGAGLAEYGMLIFYLHFFLLGILVWRLAERFPPLKASAIMALTALAMRLVIAVLGQQGEYFMNLSWIYAVLMLLAGNFTWKRRKTGVAKVFQELDRFSFDIYLVHGAVVECLTLLQAKVTLHPVVVIMLLTGLTAVGVWVTYHLIERPADAVCKKLVAKVQNRRIKSA